VLAGSLEALKAKDRLVLRRSRRPILIVYGLGRVFAVRPPVGQPFWKTEYATSILQQVGRSIEGLWLCCSVAGAQWLLSSVQVDQQGMDCVSDFSGNPYE
jgi:hypothetical protein